MEVGTQCEKDSEKRKQHLNHQKSIEHQNIQHVEHPFKSNL